MDKIWPSFDEAVADIPDGASVAVNFWAFPGVTQNLILALRAHGTKDLTLIHNAWGTAPMPEEVLVNPAILLPQMKKLITSFFVSSQRLVDMYRAPSKEAELEEKLEVEVMSHGILMARLHAAASGIGGFYSPVGVGTIVEEGKEKRVIDGREYLLEMPLKPDFGFVRAHKADKYGNLVYLGVQRGYNPVIAMASKVTIAEVDEIVEPGELDPEGIVTPAIFVDRIVQIPEGGRGSYKDSMEKVHGFLSIDWVRTIVLRTKGKEAQQ